MAWGATLFKLPEGVTAIDEVPHDYSPPQFGTTEEVFAILSNLFPEHEHRLGETSYWDGCSWVELHYDYQKTGVVDTIGVRSNGGRSTFEVLKSVCSALGLSIFDNQSGELARFDDETRESLLDFQAFRRSVIGQ